MFGHSQIVHPKGHIGKKGKRDFKDRLGKVGPVISETVILIYYYRIYLKGMGDSSDKPHRIPIRDNPHLFLWKDKGTDLGRSIPFPYLFTVHHYFCIQGEMGQVRGPG